MKKLLCLLLSILLVLSFAACDSEDDDDDDRRSSRRSKSSTSADYEDAIDLGVSLFDGSASKSDVKRLYPEDLWEYMAQESGESTEELREQLYEMLKEARADMEDEFGKDFSIEYEILEQKDVPKSEFDEFKENMEEYYGLDADSFEQCRELEMRVIITGVEEEEETSSVHMVQYDGAWYIAELLMEGF